MLPLTILCLLTLTRIMKLEFIALSCNPLARNMMYA